MKTQKKIATAVLSVALMLPSAAMAAEQDNPKIATDIDILAVAPENKCGNKATWGLSGDGTLYIIGEGDMYNSVPWKLYSNQITNVVIDDEITSIPDAAFQNTNLQGNLTLPNHLRDIGKDAFNGCNGLTGTLEIPKTVISIGRSAFKNCTDINAIHFQGNNLRTIGKEAFVDCCSARGNIEIPNGVTDIGEFAFAGCMNISEISIPDTVSQLYSNTFTNTESLQTITIDAEENSIKGAPWGAKDDVEIVWKRQNISQTFDLELVDYTYSPSNANKSKPEQFSFTVDITTKQSYSNSVTFYLAAYDSYGNLNNVSVYTGITPNTEEVQQRVFKGTVKNGNKSTHFKVFAWNRNLQPLCEPLQQQVVFMP